jgi:hypothetical protein
MLSGHQGDDDQQGKPGLRLERRHVDFLALEGKRTKSTTFGLMALS